MTETLPDPRIQSIRIDARTADDDFFLILHSRRPEPHYESSLDWVTIKGFWEKSPNKEGPRRISVPAIDRQTDIIHLAMLLFREGWEVQARYGDSYGILSSEELLPYREAARDGRFNERVNPHKIPPSTRPYSAEDLIKVRAKVYSTCVGCGHPISPGEPMLWAPVFRSAQYKRGESFHTTCEPGPIEGRSDRWEKQATDKALVLVTAQGE
jgi:hypothetical protein